MIADKYVSTCYADKLLVKLFSANPTKWSNTTADALCV